MIKLALATLLLLAATAAGNAQSAQDERDCRNDAVKLCRTVLGNNMAVLNCFQKQRPKLTRRCNAVLAKYGQ